MYLYVTSLLARKLQSSYWGNYRCFFFPCIYFNSTNCCNFSGLPASCNGLPSVFSELPTSFIHVYASSELWWQRNGTWIPLRKHGLLQEGARTSPLPKLSPLTQ